MKKEIKLYKVTSLAYATQPDSVFYVKAPNSNIVTTYITDLSGVAIPLKDLQGNASGITSITSNDGTITITGSSSIKDLKISDAMQTLINGALQSGDNISELVNDTGYLTSFSETDPIFQASEASNFVVGDKDNLDNQSGVNTGDETTLSIQTKRPLKTINGNSLEGAGNLQIDYNDLSNLPTPVASHSQLVLDDGTNPHGTTKSDVGLGNVNNTSDADKPVSNATQTALNAKLSNDPTTYTNATLPLSGTEVAILNNGVNWVKITWNNIKAQLSLLYAPKDETIITNLSVSGTYNIDYSAGNVWRLTFVGPTTLTESNVPTTGKTKTITINGNGNFPITFPGGFTGFITGSYTGTATLNTITVQTLGTDRKVQIVQPT